MLIQKIHHEFKFSKSVFYYKITILVVIKHSSYWKGLEETQEYNIRMAITWKNEFAALLTSHEEFKERKYDHCSYQCCGTTYVLVIEL